MINNSRNSDPRLHRDKKDRKIYKNLLERSGPFKSNKKFSKDIFTYALAYGYSKDENIKSSMLDDAFVNRNNFGKDLEILVNALAVVKSNKGVHILSEDSTDIYKYAEYYADVGLSRLKANYEGHEDEFIERLRLKINKQNKDNKIINKLDELKLNL